MQKIGLVFSGGGGKGAYEIGVWKALEEVGLAKDIEVVSGTSVGALNAALFAQGDLKKAENAWLSISPSDILSIDLKEVLAKILKLVIPRSYIIKIVELVRTLGLHGVFSHKGLLRIIENYLNVLSLKQGNIPCYVCATELPFFKQKYFLLQDYSQDIVKKILLASSAIPVVFPTQKIEGKEYCDGFVVDNTPIQPLVDEGCNIIIAVLLSRDELLPVDRFPSCKIIPIYPQEHQGACLSFTQPAQKIQHGYDDTMAMLKPVFDMIDTNYQYSTELLKYKEQHQIYKNLQKERHQLDFELELSEIQLSEEMKKWNL